ncbi:unnamed protein product [Choristocarpus tenellus]
MSPAMVLNEYSMKCRFQAVPDFEQVSGKDGQLEYLCSFSVGPNDRITGEGRGTSMKTAKQHASLAMLQNAARLWNEENPEDLIDMKDMEPLPEDGIGEGAGQNRAKAGEALEASLTEDWKAWVAAWVEKVSKDEIQQACFPLPMGKFERKFIHAHVEDLGDHSILSKSTTLGPGRRAISVLRRAMMEGLAAMSDSPLKILDVPPPPTLPSQVDIGERSNIFFVPRTYVSFGVVLLLTLVLYLLLFLTLLVLPLYVHFLFFEAVVCKHQKALAAEEYLISGQHTFHMLMFPGVL